VVAEAEAVVAAVVVAAVVAADREQAGPDRVRHAMIEIDSHLCI